MPQRTPLTKEAFLYLAQQAGLDVGDEHLDELFPYVQNALEGLAQLDEVAVEDFEPDLAFRAAPEE